MATTTDQPLFASAEEDGPWIDWSPPRELHDGTVVRSLEPDRPGMVILPVDRSTSRLLVLELAVESARLTWPRLKLSIDDQPGDIFQNPGFPEYFLSLVPPPSKQPSEATTAFNLLWEPASWQRAAHHPRGLATPLITSIYVLPAKGRFSRRWATPSRRFWSRLRGGPLPWSPVDFPYSHFDGVAYLWQHTEAKRALLDGEFESAVQHFHHKGHRQGKRAQIATLRPPNPGNLVSLAHWQDQELKRFSRMRLENEILRKKLAEATAPEPPEPLV